MHTPSQEQELYFEKEKTKALYRNLQIPKS